MLHKRREEVLFCLVNFRNWKVSERKVKRREFFHFLNLFLARLYFMQKAEPTALLNIFLKKWVKNIYFFLNSSVPIFTC